MRYGPFDLRNSCSSTVEPRNSGWYAPERRPPDLHLTPTLWLLSPIFKLGSKLRSRRSKGCVPRRTIKTKPHPLKKTPCQLQQPVSLSPLQPSQQLLRPP